MLNKLASLTDENEIKQAVTDIISPYGQIESLHIFEPIAQHNHLVILVTMNNLEQANSAKNALGVSSFGHNSLIITVPRLAN